MSEGPRPRWLGLFRLTALGVTSEPLSSTLNSSTNRASTVGPRARPPASAVGPRARPPGAFAPSGPTLSPRHAFLQTMPGSGVQRLQHEARTALPPPPGSTGRPAPWETHPLGSCPPGSWAGVAPAYPEATAPGGAGEPSGGAAQRQGRSPLARFSLPCPPAQHCTRVKETLGPGTRRLWTTQATLATRR